MQITRTAILKGKAKVSKVTQGKQGNGNKKQTITQTLIKRANSHIARNQVTNEQDKNRNIITKEANADQSQVTQTKKESIHKQM